MIYSFLTWLIQPLVSRKLGRRAASEPLFGEHIEERFGRYRHFDKLSANGIVEHAHCPLIWIHAVSLGETRAAKILLKELRLAMPTMRLLLTNGTATGRAEGAKLLREGDIQVWQPWDTRAATRAFFTHFKPTLGVLMETEIWPNLIASARTADVPVTLVNARMSDKSFRQSQRWYVSCIASQAYRSLTAVFAQTQDDAARLTKLGATVSGIFGNLKFDITPDSQQVLAGKTFRLTYPQPIILFASSREGEEAPFLAALQALPEAQRASAQWLIVPRHPQRFDEVADLIDAAGLGVSRRSQQTDFGKFSPNGSKAIWLGDSIGDMAFYYSLASAALLGGSFANLGGQNLIEALACGCPVIMGPHTFNFEEVAQQASLSGVAFRVKGLQSAIQWALQQVEWDRNQAKQFVDVHQGASQHLAAHLSLLSQRTNLRVKQGSSQ